MCDQYKLTFLSTSSPDYFLVLLKKHMVCVLTCCIRFIYAASTTRDSINDII